MRKKYGKRKLRRPRRKSSKARRISSVKSIVNRAISRNIETKYVSTHYGLTAFNGGISSAGDLVTVLPACVVGGGQVGRLGHSIRPVKMVIRGYVIYRVNQPQQAYARMIGVRLFVLEDKANKSYNNELANYNILSEGGVSFNYSGTVRDYNAPVNTDMFKFYAQKKWIMLKDYGNTSAATGSIASISPTLYRPFKIVLTKKHLPAVLKYDTTDGGDYPCNFAPYIALGYSDMFDLSPDTTVTQINMSFTSTLYFKDA